MQFPIGDGISVEESINSLHRSWEPLSPTASPTTISNESLVSCRLWCAPVSLYSYKLYFVSDQSSLDSVTEQPELITSAANSSCTVLMNEDIPVVSRYLSILIIDF